MNIIIAPTPTEPLCAVETEALHTKFHPQEAPKTITIHNNQALTIKLASARKRFNARTSTGFAYSMRVCSPTACAAGHGVAQSRREKIFRMSKLSEGSN